MVKVLLSPSPYLAFHLDMPDTHHQRAATIVVEWPMDWKPLLVHITGFLDEELRLRNAYLAVGNRILRTQIRRRVQFTDAERKTLVEIGEQLGRQALERLRRLRSLTPSSPSTTNLWLSRVTAHSRARLSDVPASTRSWKASWCVWPASTPSPGAEPRPGESLSVSTGTSS